MGSSAYYCYSPGRYGLAGIRPLGQPGSSPWPRSPLLQLAPSPGPPPPPAGVASTSALTPGCQTDTPSFREMGWGAGCSSWGEGGGGCDPRGGMYLQPPQIPWRGAKLLLEPSISPSPLPNYLVLASSAVQVKGGCQETGTIFFTFPLPSYLAIAKDKGPHWLFGGGGCALCHPGPRKPRVSPSKIGMHDRGGVHQPCNCCILSHNKILWMFTWAGNEESTMPIFVLFFLFLSNLTVFFMDFHPTHFSMYRISAFLGVREKKRISPCSVCVCADGIFRKNCL